MARRACARLGAPIPEAPAAQEYHETEPRSHRRRRCWDCLPLALLANLRGALAGTACSSRSSPAQPCGNFGLGVSRGTGAAQLLWARAHKTARADWLLPRGNRRSRGAGAREAGSTGRLRLSATPLCTAAPAARSYIARRPGNTRLGRAGPPPPTNGRAALPHRPSEGAGPGARAGGAGPALTVQILIGNNAALGTRVGGLGAPGTRGPSAALPSAARRSLSVRPWFRVHPTLWVPGTQNQNQV